MTDHDVLDWLAAAQPTTEPPDELATRRARNALLTHARHELWPASAGPPRAPARRARERRWLRPSRVLALAGAAAVVAFAATSIPAGDGVSGSLRAEEATAAPLVRLSEHVAQQPAPRGTATLVRRHHVFADGSTMNGLDLYLDDGRYYYGSTLQELRAAIGQDADIGPGTARGVAAAEQAAVRRDAAADRAAMIAATFTGNPNPPDEPLAQDDNRVWFGCMDALLAGAGRPEVRSGVLFLLSTVSTVTTAEGTIDGRATLELHNAGFPDGYVETLVVDAESGIPVRFVGGNPGQEPSVTMTYRIERTTPQRVEKG